MKFLVLLATHNGAATLRPALESAKAVLAGKEWFLFVGLDACTDDSYRICTEFAKTSGAQYVSLVNYPKALNAADAKNRVIRQAQAYMTPGSFVLWVDDDEELLAPLITELWPQFVKEDELYAVGTHMSRTQQLFQTHPAPENGPQLCFGPAATIARAELYRNRLDFFPTKYSISEDIAAWWRLGVEEDIWPLVFDTRPVLLSVRNKVSSVSRPGPRAYEANATAGRVIFNDYREPSSISTIVTPNYQKTFKRFLTHLRRFHPDTPVFVLCTPDTQIKEHGVITFPLLGNNLTDSEIWKQKPHICATACHVSGDTYWLDSDIILLQHLTVPFGGRVPVFTAELHHKWQENQAGSFNGGMLYWPHLSYIAEWEARFADVKNAYESAKRFVEQQALQLVSDYRTRARYVHNFGFWHTKGAPAVTREYNTVFHRGRVLRSVHCHFAEDGSGDVAYQNYFAETLKPYIYGS